jgi:DNA-binding LacI/PurR family transcriptional regulator
MFNTSKIPVRYAMRKFIDQGILEKQHGKGTFVRRTRTRSKKTGRLGVLYCPKDVGFFSSSFYTAIITGIEMEANKADQQLLYRSFRKRDDQPYAEAIYELNNEVDAFLVVDFMEEIRQQVIPVLETSGKPVVVLNHEAELENIDTIATDSRGNITRMVNFLHGLGHKRIACCYSASRIEKNLNVNFQNRVDGYEAAMAELGLQKCETLCLKTAYQPGSGQFDTASTNTPSPADTCSPEDIDAVRSLLKRPDAPTAFMCISDETALNVYRIARQLGLTIPDDLTVTGYDNIRETVAVLPGLTTVHVPLVEMGAMGVRRVIEKLKEAQSRPNLPVRSIIPGRITERESHKAL